MAATPKKRASVAVDHVVVTEEEYIPTKTIRKTTPYISNYEYASLVLARMLQLSAPNGRPMISKKDITLYDPMVIATREINMRLPPLVIRRHLPDGSVEDWLLTDEENPLIFPRS